MITTICLINIHHHTQIQFYFFDENFQDLLFYQLSNMYYSIINYSLHTVPKEFLNTI